MSRSATRALLATAITGGVLALAAAPAGAAEAGLSAKPHSDSTRAAAGGSAAAVDPHGTADITGAAAAAVGFSITGAQCFSNDVAFTANTYETGFSGVQRFRQKAQLQMFTTAGWVNKSSVSVVTSTRFPNDGRSFQFVRDWDGTHISNGASWRVVWQGLYLNGGGAVIAKTKPIAVTCA